MGKFIGAVLIYGITFLIDAAIVQALWNCVLVYIFEPVAHVSFLQAMGVKFLISTLFPKGGK